MQSLVILVTGASSGFGKAIAEVLIHEGHIVYGTSRRPFSTDTNQQLRPLIMDVTDEKSIQQAVKKIISEQQHIDVLINNAGMGVCGAIELATAEEVSLQMSTNFIGMVNVCREVVQYMRARRKGKVINISSIAGVFAVPYQGLYSASKFAMEGYSEALCLETKQFGLEVIIVEPGDFNTGFTANRQLSALTQSNCDYKASFERVLKAIEQDERSGGEPILLAKKVAKIVRRKRNRFRYLVAKNPIQKIAVVLSHILPYKWFLGMIRVFYKV